MEQAPHSPKYVPDPIELEDHVLVYIPEPEHPKDLVPAKDEAPIEGHHHCFLYHCMENPLALTRSEAYSRALEARVTVLETQARRHEWQRQDADDHATRHIMRIQALEAGARNDTLEDTGSSA
ncbi:hypothetical protein Tco_1281171 [Tanacetum coccineum]